MLVLLARLLPAWKAALMIVQPDTLIRWHRGLFKIVWRRKSKAKTKAQPAALSVTTIWLIWQMATDNRLWSAERCSQHSYLRYPAQGKISHCTNFLRQRLFRNHVPVIAELHAFFFSVIDDHFDRLG